MIKKLLTIFSVASLGGCMNMPTPPEQITGSYVSSVKYEGFDCKKLRNELSELSSREDVLVLAQERRINTGNIQAFWVGFGNGDGIEAFELASVRGERAAARKSLLRNECPKTTKEMFGL